MKKRIIIPSLVTIVLCLSLIAGSTFALFSEETNIGVTIYSGNVDIEVEITDLQTMSMGKNTAVNGEFDLKGTAKITDTYAIAIDKMTPGDAVSVNIKITNNSNVPISYCVRMIGDGKLVEALEASVTVNGVESVINSTENMSAWVSVDANANIDPIPVTIYFPNADNNNEYKNLLGNTIRLQVVAVQGNGIDIYESVDTFWYDSTKDTLEISTASDLVGFAKLVNAGNTFAGKTVKLTSDIDLGGAEWTPIGVTEGFAVMDESHVFRGTFDGADHTISNFTITGEHDVGFFRSPVATIKNVNFDNAHVTGTHWVGVVAGRSFGTIQSCKVTNFTVTSNVELVGENKYDNGDKAGAVVGLATDSLARVIDCTAENGTVKAFRDLGTVVGAAQTSTTCTGLSSTGVVTVPDGGQIGDINKNMGDPVGRIVS